MKVVCGNSNRSLGESIARCLDIELSACLVSKFPDGEVLVEVQENMRGEDVFVVQSISDPANEHLMELFLIVDALRRASVERVTAVLPYFGYARQDRRGFTRTPISAKLVANLITTSGVNRVLTLDLHSDHIQGFFDIPVDHLLAVPVIAKNLIEIHGSERELVIVSPDVGGIVRARAMAHRLNAQLAIVDKRRKHKGDLEIMNIIGDVRGKVCILCDDIVDSGKTLINATKALLDHGAEEVKAYVTHGVFSSDTVDRIISSDLKNLIVTDSIEATETTKNAKTITVISIAPLLAEAIARTNQDGSISSLVCYES